MQPMNVNHVHAIVVCEKTNAIVAIPAMKPIIASICFTLLNNTPSKNEPSSPPYVTDAMLSASSTNALDVLEMKKIATPTSTTHHTRENNRERNKSRASEFCLPKYGL